MIIVIMTRGRVSEAQFYLLEVENLTSLTCEHKHYSIT